MDEQAKIHSNEIKKLAGDGESAKKEFEKQKNHEKLAIEEKIINLQKERDSI